jgi:hypothetical protein
MTAAPELSDRRGMGKFYRISLLAHVSLLGIVLMVPGARNQFITRILPPPPAPESMQERKDSGEAADSVRELFDRALDEFQKTPSDAGAAENARSAGLKLADAARQARERFAREQARQLSEKLGISPEEALKILPQPDSRDFERLIRQLTLSAESDPSQSARLRALREMAGKLAADAENNDRMAAQLAQGETPVESLTIVPDPQTRDAAKTLLADSAAAHMTEPRDFTGLMRSYYGDEIAQGGAPSSAQALLDDAVPGRVQTTKSGLRPPPLLDNKWLSSVYRGESLPSLAASRISTAGHPARSGLIFLDSWYVLGPWPLESQNDFWKAFPPESDGVDLEAEYTGKRGRRLKWEFIQSRSPLVEIPLQVPDSTTYAFTTLEFEQETEAWMLCGSDDRMKLWINGLPVFGSAASLKGWHIGNEGARKVLFLKGRNEILVRVDNLPGFTRFSVVLMPTGSEEILFSTIR